ncbi:MAG: heme-copper oxidase subunit III [Myxococcaceae bacterium]|nr:heme-copper oxidase subunit III [Myxococcaceae bacterium]
MEAVLPQPQRGSPQRLPQRRPVVPSAMLGMLVFIVTEIMFFAGFISAFTISKANAVMGMWPPPGQPRLPAEATLLNTAVLLVSGVLLFVAYRRFRVNAPSKSLYLVAFVLGAAFVGLQGREWVMLLGAGMTMTSSTLGSFFYLIVGTHALHVAVCIVAMGFGFVRLQKGTLSREFFLATLSFWVFVVGAWPIIYLRVYF